MSNRSDKAMEILQQRIFTVRNKNPKFKNRPMPNVMQVQLTAMALAEVMNIPMIELIDKILETDS